MPVFRTLRALATTPELSPSSTRKSPRDGRLQLDIGNYTAAALGAPRIDDGNWHHCAIVVPAWNQSNLGQVRFHVDGISYPAQTANPSIQILTRTTSFSGHLRLGRHAINTNSPYNGELDDFVIWGRALSTAELSLLHSFGTSSLNYDVAKADPLLKAFRAGRGVVIDDVTWFHVASDLRGASGTAYDLDGDYILPLAAGTGMTTIGSEFQRALKASIPSLDMSGNQITLSWNSLPGASYVIKSCDQLDGEWTDAAVGIVSQGTSTSHILTESLPPRRFYRVIETP
jgi:hypothetical protein